MGSDYLYISDFEKASINLELRNVSTQNICEYILEHVEPSATKERVDKFTDINMATNRRQGTVQRKKSISSMKAPNLFQSKRRKSTDTEAVPVIAETLSDTNPESIKQFSDDLSGDIVKADVPAVVIPSIEEENDDLTDLIASENVKKGGARQISVPGQSNPNLLTGLYSDIERSSSRMKLRLVIVG